jgi:hypothetical protein
MTEETSILQEFQSVAVDIRPEEKSNNRLNGHFFACIAMNRIKPYINTIKYREILGPLWIKGQEWVEWDGAIIRKEAKEILPQYFESNDVFALFEFKTSGIYGRKKHKKGKGKTVKEVVAGIKGNFLEAQSLCPNLAGAFYITLHERKPTLSKKQTKKRPIDYYKETQKLKPEVVPCALFNSTSFTKKSNRKIPLDKWNIISEELKKSLN